MADHFHTLRRPDYSPLVVHLTKDRGFVKHQDLPEEHPLKQQIVKTARQRLESILAEKTIYASPMPFLPGIHKAVCFTECVWDALLHHIPRYSEYGVVFNKDIVHRQGGGPALYARGDLVRDVVSNVPDSLMSFIAPFDPDSVLSSHTPLEFLHEREWRLPSDFTFHDSQIEYVLVKTIDDVNTFVDRFGTDRIPLHKYIPMEVYRAVKKGWL